MAELHELEIGQRVIIDHPEWRDQEWFIDEIDDGWVGVVPQGCVGLAAAGVGQDAFMFDYSTMEPAGDGVWYINEDRVDNG